jgi:hypothetical protein
MCITFGNPSEPCCGVAPPKRLAGNIERRYIPESIEDYAGISTAVWQSGTTGEVLANRNCQCLYHHFTTPNMRTTSVFNVMNPLRFRPAAPDTNGGQFDIWAQPASIAMANNVSVGFAQTGRAGLSQKFLPRDWHGKFRDGIAEVFLSSFIGMADICKSNDGGFSATELNLNAIRPDLPFWQYVGSGSNFPCGCDPFAIQHRINGRPVKRLYTRPEFNTIGREAFSVKVRPGDVWEIDVWFEVGISAAPNYAMLPAKGVCYFAGPLVSNGSRVRQMRSVFFGNVDWQTAVNPDEHTYTISIAGHRGWTLKASGNGPHKLETDDEWVAGTGGGVASAYPRLSSSAREFCRGIRLNWSQEIPEIVLFNGSESDPRVYLYRSELSTDGHYLEQTQSTEFGTVQHAFAGRFDQGGTTVFRLVPWSQDGSFSDGMTPDTDTIPGQYYFEHLAEGSFGPANPIPRTVPRTITVSRVGRI